MTGGMPSRISKPLSQWAPTAPACSDADRMLADGTRVPGLSLGAAAPSWVPLIGFTNHTDTAGLRAAHGAGFDQVMAKSALVERCPTVVEELLAPVE